MHLPFGAVVAILLGIAAAAAVVVILGGIAYLVGRGDIGVRIRRRIARVRERRRIRRAKRVRLHWSMILAMAGFTLVVAALALGVWWRIVNG